MFTHKGKTPVELKGMLKVKNVTRNDAGIYMCEAQDFDAEDGVRTYQKSKLIVHCKYQSQTL